MKVRAGAGGNGCTAFHHEPRAPKGGPSGGDGGNGGDIVLECSEGLDSLAHLRASKSLKSGNGEPGSSGHKKGSDGAPLVIRVPIGTSVYHDGILKADLLDVGNRLILAKGGKGGKGNATFKSATNQAPVKSTPGEPGEEDSVRLELKTIADAALVGPPNSGKSSLLASLTGVSQPAAPYPFATKRPRIVHVQVSPASRASLLDLPSVARGASEGAGLGNRHLKHAERSKIVLCVLDLSMDPLEEFKFLTEEVSRFGRGLLDKEWWIVGSKLDLCRQDGAKHFLDATVSAGLSAHVVSTESGEGIASLREALWNKLT